MNEIKAYFKNHKITAKEIAIKMDINPHALRKHLNGNPSLEVIHRIADAVGCDISDFFRSDGPEKKKEDKSNLICPHCGKEIQILIK